MPFAADTKVRVMMALELPLNVPAYVQHVQEALFSAETYGGDAAVTAIESYLTQYETAQTSLNSDSGNGGLIRADVLEWSPGGKTAGLQTEMGRLQMKIAKVLMLEDLMSNKPNRVKIRRS